MAIALSQIAGRVYGGRGTWPRHPPGSWRSAARAAELLPRCAPSRRASVGWVQRGSYRRVMNHSRHSSLAMVSVYDDRRGAEDDARELVGIVAREFAGPTV